MVRTRHQLVTCAEHPCRKPHVAEFNRHGSELLQGLGDPGHLSTLLAE
jgi:hypothetical protein